MNNEEQKKYTLDQIIEKSFDFSGFPEEEKNKMIAETSGLIMETALLKSVEESGEEMQIKFNDFIDGEPNEDEMSHFIQENFPNFGDIVIDEIKNFQKNIIENNKKAEE